MPRQLFTHKVDWFKFSVVHWVGSRKVQRMNMAARGVYLEMLCAAWDDPYCSLPTEPDEIIELINCTKEEFNLAWPTVSKCFIEDEININSASVQRLFNERLYAERVEAETRLAKSSQGGKTAAERRAQTRIPTNKTVCDSINSSALHSPLQVDSKCTLSIDKTRQDKTIQDITRQDISHASRGGDDVDSSQSNHPGKPDSSEVMSAWNDTADRLAAWRIPKCAHISPKSTRAKALSQRWSEKWWRENYKAALDKLFALVEKNKFFQGENDSGWKPNFEWFVRTETVSKLIEGSYDGNSTGKLDIGYKPLEGDPF